MREKKLTRREREIEEAFYCEAWRMEAEEWWEDGSMMEGQVGARAVSMREQTNPYVYALGDRTTVWDGGMKGIQMALEGAEKE